MRAEHLAGAPIEIQLVRPHWVHVRLRSTEGAPVEGKRVSALASNGIRISVTTTTNELGFARIGPLATRPHRIRVRDRLDDGGFDVEPEADPTDATLSTAHASLTLDDEVTPVRGRPARTVEVFVSDPQGTPVPRASMRWPGRIVDGRGTIRVTEDDRFLDVFGARTTSGLRLPLGRVRVPMPTDARRLEVTMPRERVIAGIVRAPPDAHARGVTVTVAELDGGRRWSAYTNRHGRFTVHGIAPADTRYELSVKPRDETLLPPPSQEVASGAADVAFQLREAPRVTIFVVDRGSHPLPGVSVTAYGQRGRHQAVSDERGRAVFLNLDPEETYRLSAGGNGWQYRTQEVWKPRDTTARLTPVVPATR